MKFLLAFACATLLAATLHAVNPPPIVGSRSAVYAPRGAAATSQPLATSTAIRILDQGGNAIDAAVAAAAVLTVTEPMMTGIGGDMFAIVWSAKEQKLSGLNASGRAGSRMTREELLRRGHKEMPELGAETVTVPGALAGWQALLERHGTMKLRDVLKPAIEYAEKGFPVTPVIANGWTGDFGSAAELGRNADFNATFLGGSARAPRAGDWFRNPDYAATLRMIAEQGVDAFYRGTIARRIVEKVQSGGGFLTLEDLARNEPTWVTPISTVYKGYRVWQLPPNNQGIAVLEMLRILEPYDLKSMGHNTAPYLHHLIEAKKLAYADLVRFGGDADHLELSPAEILSDDFIAQRRSKIDSAKAKTRVDPGPARTKSDTIYLTVADEAGNMVSFINSNYGEWGSQVVVPGSGFVLQNRGNGFSLEPDIPNTVAPGKRPFHTLIPGFVTRPAKKPSPDGSGDQPYMSFGLMGGAMQAQGHVQFLLNVLVFDMDLQRAMDVGRFRHVKANRVSVEHTVSPEVIAELQELGHQVKIATADNFGGSQAIAKLKSGYVAASDPRKDGHAAGR